MVVDLRSRTAEHGLEKRGKPVVLPILALLVALYGWWDTNVAAQGQTISMLMSEAEDARAAHEGKPDSLVTPSKNSSPAAAAPIHGIDNGTAVTCERHPLITHCFRLTQERR